MTAPLMPFDQLPCRTFAELRDHWDDVVHEVQEHGALRLADSREELVLLSATTYQALWLELERLRATDQESLEVIKARWSEQLQSTQDPESRERIEQMFAAKGQSKKPPIAGESS